MSVLFRFATCKPCKRYSA